MYYLTYPLTDRPVGNPLVTSVQWIESVALGSLSSTVAIIAVAVVGLLMLSGRVTMSRAVTVVLGCFILFGAAGIASALVGWSNDAVHVYEETPDYEGDLLAHLPAQHEVPIYDPYAGASVPEMQR